MKKKVSLKNYILVSLIICSTIFLTLGSCKLYNLYLTQKYETSYLLKNKIITQKLNDIEKLKDIIGNEKTFILISKINDEDIYDLEKDLKDIINHYNLKNNFYYLDGTNFTVNDLKEINEILNLKNKEIKKLPTIIYIDKELTDAIIREDENIINAGDFEQLLDIYEIKR